MNFTLESGKTVGLEKNSRVEVKFNGFSTAGVLPSNMLVVDGKGVQLKEFILKGEAEQKENFYRYNSSSYNCQQFIRVMMESNGIMGTRDFVLQSADKLINSTSLAKGAKVITDVHALGQRFLYGHGTKGKGRMARRSREY